MSKYYVLSHDSNQDDLAVVSDYEMGNFDLTRLWSGGEFQGSFPPDVRLWVTKGEQSDYLGNPLSWPIISDRLWNLICGLAEQCCQILDVPLYFEGTETSVEGFSLMNVTCTVAAAKPEESQPDHSIGNLVLDGNKIPTDAHVFRLAESSTLILVSNAVREKMSGKQLQGIALIEVPVM